MASESRSHLQFFFLPALAHGHMIPMVDMAKAVASRGVKATIVTTPVNAALISKSIQKTNHVSILTVKFPSVDGLPEGCENVDSTPPHLLPKFILSQSKLQDSVDELLRDHRPHCLVADYLYSWATDVAGRYNIPRLVFHVTYFFSLCASICMSLHRPLQIVPSDYELFEIPDLPGGIQMTMAQVGNFVENDEETDMAKLLKAAAEAEAKCHGIVINSFYELEPAYADYYRKELGKKAWHVGPLLLFKGDNTEKVKAHRGKESTIDENACLKWLDAKEPNSVIYVCFGSMTMFRAAQLRELALALEASGHQFIWTVRKHKFGQEEQEEWLPEGFESRTEGRGLIIRGWAPQVLILGHKAMGAFLTHCGSNSTLEGICAGLPMVTWPVFGDHFYIEQLVTQVLKIGVSVGCKRHVGLNGDNIKSEAIEEAVKRIMEGAEAEEMRERAKGLAQMSKRAVEEGGSSYMDLEALIEEIASHAH